MEEDIDTYSWEDNIKNCHIPMERAVVISNQTGDYPWLALYAGRLLSELKIEKEKVGLHRCGCWLWLRFDDVADSVAFKLLWEE